MDRRHETWNQFKESAAADGTLEKATQLSSELLTLEQAGGEFSESFGGLGSAASCQAIS